LVGKEGVREEVGYRIVPHLNAVKIMKKSSFFAENMSIFFYFGQGFLENEKNSNQVARR